MNDCYTKHNKYPHLSECDKWCHNGSIDKSSVRKIRILSEFNNVPTQDESFDVSANQDAGVTLHISEDKTEIIIAGNGSHRITVGPDMSKMFAGFTVLEEIEGLELLDTSEVTDMSYLFHHCISLQELDLSSWDVSKVINFRGTFCCGENQIGNARLNKLNISTWDVSGATDMAYMFYGCGNLKHIDVSNWDTSNVTNFRHTFADCFKLHKIDVSNWNTGSAITLDGIFNDCRSIEYIDISNWDTSSCREFDQFFDNCISLRRIHGLDKLNTTAGISFEEMFYGCRKITSLDLSAINTRGVDGREFTAYDSSINAVSNMNKILVGLNSLRRIKLGSDFVFYNREMKSNALLEKLNWIGCIVVSPETGSMKPFICNKADRAMLVKQKKYLKNDIVLYAGDDGSKLILHRIIKVLKDGYLIQGDHSLYGEYVPKEYVYAGATEIYKSKGTIRRSSISYRLQSLYSRAYNQYRYKYKHSDSYIWKNLRLYKRRIFSKLRNHKNV